MMFALLALALGASPVQLGPVHTTDDNAHFTIMMLGAGGAYAAFTPLTESRPARLFAALSIPLSAGLAREFTQAQAAGRWDRENTRDMGWNLAGATFGAVFSYALDRCVSREAAWR